FGGVFIDATDARPMCMARMELVLRFLPRRQITVDLHDAHDRTPAPAIAAMFCGLSPSRIALSSKISSRTSAACSSGEKSWLSKGMTRPPTEAATRKAPPKRAKGGWYVMSGMRRVQTPPRHLDQIWMRLSALL